MDAKMFCYQCQETAGNKGCTVQGVCGKKFDVARAQDLLIYVTKGLGGYDRAQSGGQAGCGRGQSPRIDEPLHHDYERKL